MADSSSALLQALLPGGALTGTLTGVGALYGLSQLAGSLGGALAPQKQVFRQSRPARWRGYGQCQSAGPLAFFGYDTGQNRLWQVVVLHDGEIDGVLTHYFGDEALTLVGGDAPDFSSDADVVVEPGHFRDGGRWCRIDVKPGADDQDALERLHSHIPSQWTEGHRLAGVAVTFMDLLSPESKDFDSVFTHGIPAYSAVLRCAKVYDPRDPVVTITSFEASGIVHTASDHGLHGPRVDTNGKKFPGDYVFVQGVSGLKSGRYYVRTTPTSSTLTLRERATGGAITLPSTASGGKISKCKFSMNLALCLLDYLTHPSGMDLPWELFEGALGTANKNDWGAQANICDEVMPLKDGGTVPRWHISGGYQLTERPVDVLSKITRVGDARLFLSGDGFVRTDVAKFEEPTVWFTDDDILDWSGFQRSKDPAEIKNVITAKYVSPDQNYEATDADPWRNEDSVAANGEQALDLDLSFARDHPTARYRMKIDSFRGDPEWSGGLVFNARGMLAWGERLVGIDSSRHGFRAVFEVMDISSFDVETGNSTIYLSAMPISATDRDPETDEGTAPISASYADSSSVELPADLVVTASAGKLNATWTAPTDSGATPVLAWRTHDIAVPDETATWTDFPTVDKTAHTAQSGTVSSGTYDARMKYSGGLYVFVRSIIAS